MDSLSVVCKLCGHTFKDHACSEDLRLWWCQGNLGACVCDNYYPLQDGSENNEIEVPYDSESYKWN